MSVAEHADAVVLLVSDIDRGGAFASLFGTWALLENADRERIKGFLLNRFRGDAGLLAPAPEVLERRTGVPVVGVVPWIRHLLPEEDGPPPLQASPDDGALPHGTPADTEASGRTPTPVVVGVVAFPHFSNADDLDPLRAEPQVRLRSVRRVQDLFGVDALILPGSRNTLADLAWLFETGIADGVRGLGRSGTPILGICGGYQMLGSQVLDPLGVEGGGAREGLGLLPVETVLSQRKETRLTLARIRAGDHLFNDLEGAEVEGYEIHHGRSVAKQAAIPWIEAEAGPLGHARGPVWGGYLHGILESEQLRLAWLRALGVERAAGGSWGTRLEAEIDRLADEVEANVDLERIIGWLGLGGNS